MGRFNPSYHQVLSHPNLDLFSISGKIQMYDVCHIECEGPETDFDHFVESVSVEVYLCQA